jgi:hypothetical protein
MTPRIPEDVNVPSYKTGTIKEFFALNSVQCFFAPSEIEIRLNIS